MAWLLIAFFVVALLAAIVVHLPETVNAPFVLVPREGADPIQSPRLAVVNRVSVVRRPDGQGGRGVVRFALGRNSRLEYGAGGRLTEDLRTHEESLTKTDAAYAAQTGNQERRNLTGGKRSAVFARNTTSSNRDLVARMEKLSKSGGISQVESDPIATGCGRSRKRTQRGAANACSR